MNNIPRGPRAILVIFVLLLAGLLTINYTVLGGAKQVKLEPAPPLAGQVSQNLVTAGNSQSLPLEGIDYNLKNTTYFNNKQWVVTSIVPINNDFNAGLAVFSQQNGVYRIVLGPGSAFSKEELRSVPPEVANYLSQQGAVYESVVDQ